MIRRFPLISYFILAYGLTWIIELPMMYAARGVVDLHLPHWLEALAAFGPFIAAIIVLKATHGGDGVRKLIAGVTHWRVPGVWLAVTLLSPFVVMFAALIKTGEVELFFSGELFRQISAEGRWFDLLVMGALLRGIGEEPGWRGLALPLLRGRYGPLLATLILWPVWTCWHLPSFLMRPEFALGAWVGFSFGLLAAAALSTLIYDRTRSVLMIVIWNALINIPRGLASAASTEAFFAFAQVMILIGVVIIIYWLVMRPGKYT